MKVIKTKKKTCLSCKKGIVDFHLHECKRAVQEYYGCNLCGDWCTSCKSNWQINDKKE